MKASTRKLWVWVLAVWGAALIISLYPRVVDLYRENRKVQRAFTEYVGSLVSQDFEKAYAQCGTAFRKAMTYEEFVDLYKSLERKYGRLKSAKRAGWGLRGRGTPMYWKAVFETDLVYEKESLRFELVFHKEDNRWVLFGAEQL